MNSDTEQAEEREHEVVWRTLIDGIDHRQAALRALAVMRDIKTGPRFLEVTATGGSNEKMEAVDLLLEDLEPTAETLAAEFRAFLDMNPVLPRVSADELLNKIAAEPKLEQLGGHHQSYLENFSDRLTLCESAHEQEEQGLVSRLKSSQARKAEVLPTIPAGAELAGRPGCGLRGEDLNYPVEEWSLDVAEDNTRLGYWDWVSSAMEADLEAMQFGDKDAMKRLVRSLGEEFMQHYQPSVDPSAQPKRAPAPGM